MNKFKYYRFIPTNNNKKEVGYKKWDLQFENYDKMVMFDCNDEMKYVLKI